MLVLIGPRLRAQATEAKPSQVTDSAIAAGKELFHGVGACNQCHGDNGIGTDDGPALVQGPWKLGDGSYPSLVHITNHAGVGAVGRSDDPRAMRGPILLDSAQVRQVAAYIWSISRNKVPAPPRP
jgi:mono/diheme cytochrome c family protein